MKRLQNFVRGVEAFALFFALWLEQWAEQYLFKNNSAPLALLLLAAFVGLVVFVKLAQFLVTRWVDKSPTLRRLILGDDYIEGFWFNKVQTHDAALFGLLRIKVTEGGVTVHGEQYDESGRLTATWDSQMAEYHNNTLQYAYLVKYVGRSDTQDVYGFSDISFSKVTGCPGQYTGRFQDISPIDKTANTFTFVGSRVVEKPKLAHLMGTGKQGVVLELIADAAKNV